MLMVPTLLAATETAEGLPLGLSLSAFAVQLVTFIFVFFILKKFAFTPIVKLLEKRRQTIEDGVKLGEKMEQREAMLEEESNAVIRAARVDADHIIANAHKESREVLRKAEKDAKTKADSVLSEAQEKIEQETEHARRRLEKDIVGLVSEATETVVHEKVDAKKDAELIDRALKGRKK
jgi:F-type H+-transporting ATPase subunit b